MNTGVDKHSRTINDQVDELFEKIEKTFCEKFFFYFLVLSMICVPVAEFVSECIGFQSVTQPVILMIIGYFGFIVCVSKIISNIRKKNFVWQDFFCVSLVVFAAISLVFSTDIEISLGGFEYNEFPAVHLAYFSLMYSGFQLKNKDYRKKMILVFILLAFFEGIIGILQTFEIKIMPVLYGETTTQVYGLTQNTNFYGGLSVLFVGVTASTFIFSLKDKYKVLIGIVFAIAIYCSINTMARLAWVGDFAVLLFLGISLVIKSITQKKHKSSADTGFEITKTHYYRLLIVVAVTILVVGISFLKSDLPKGKIDASFSEVNSSSFDSFGSSRGYIWRFILESVPKHWVTGIGLNNLRSCFIENPEWEAGMYFQDKAHNEYLHILATEGVFALINYLCLLFISAKHAIRRIICSDDRVESILTWIALAMFTGYVVQALFNSSVLNVAMYFWIVIGILNPKERGAELLISKK